MNAVVAPRIAAKQFVDCHCCGRYSRVAVIWIDKLESVDVRRQLLLCSACCRAAWDAAKVIKP